jgi:hypothetical protein
MSCQKADAHLARSKLAVRETVDARKQKLGARDLPALLAGATRLVAARGAKRLDFDLSKLRPNDAELLAAVIGPTGNLRAPAVRIGKTWLVGFGEAAWKDLLG